MKILEAFKKHSHIFTSVMLLLLFMQTCSLSKKNTILLGEVEVQKVKVDSLITAVKIVNSSVSEQKEILQKEFEFINALSQDQRNISNKSLNSLLTVLAQKNKVENEKK